MNGSFFFFVQLNNSKDGRGRNMKSHRLFVCVQLTLASALKFTQSRRCGKTKNTFEQWIIRRYPFIVGQIDQKPLHETSLNCYAGEHVRSFQELRSFRSRRLTAYDVCK